MSNQRGFSATPHTGWERTIIVALGAAIIVGVLLLAFTWPGQTASAKNVPIAVAGPSAQVSALSGTLEKNSNGALTVSAVDDRDAAVALIKTRAVYGAIVLGNPPEVLSASANGAVVSQIVGGIARELQAQVNAATAAQVPAGQAVPTPPTVTVTDVVPLASGDRNGVGLASAAFPLTLGGMLGGILVSLMVVGAWRRLVALVVYAAVASGVIVAVVQAWYGVLQGSALLNFLAIALSLLGTGALIVGLSSLIGRAGIAIGAVTTILLANPISAATLPQQFLLEPWGAVGAWFVPGASVTLLRDLSYFPAADALFPWLVLAGWAVVGVTFGLVGHFRNQEGVHVEGSHEEPAPARVPAHADIA